MKKIFTLAIGSLFALSVMAASNRPSITVKNSGNYQVVIDGKSYNGNNYMNLSEMYPGYHSVKVYKMNKHFMFRKKTKLISSSDFSFKGNDVMINIDRFGRIDIKDSGFGYDNDRDHNKGWDKENKGFGRNDQHDNHKEGHDRQF